MNETPYKARSLKGAQTYVRMLLKQRSTMNALIDECHRDRVLMAKLAAEGPAFDNPLKIVEAKNIRNQILRLHCKLNPDGSFIK